MIDSSTLEASQHEYGSHVDSDFDDDAENSPDVPQGSDEPLLNSPLIDELSQIHVGSWNKLVSRTNWEKGVLVCEWRKSMVAANLPRTTYSDESWARRVGKVTPQHVGRLRRVHERFSEIAEKYASLFWSHFQAALDWDDAELWLQGAVDNAWSVAQMRFQRWETLGAPDDQKPRDEDVVLAEIPEDVYSREELLEVVNRGLATVDRIEPRKSEIGPGDIHDKTHNGFDDPPFAMTDEDRAKKDKKAEKSRKKFGEEETEAVDGVPTGELLAKLADFSDCPADLADAFESLKVALLNHKLSGWKEIAQSQVLQRIDIFRALVCSVERNERNL